MVTSPPQCQNTLHATYLLNLLNKMYKYAMDPTRTIGTTELTQDAGWTDGRSEPQQLRSAGGIIRSLLQFSHMT